MAIRDRIQQALNGEIEPEALGKYWKHDLAMPIYERACHILKQPRDKRRAMIESHAPRIADLVGAEVTRLHRLYKPSK